MKMRLPQPRYIAVAAMACALTFGLGCSPAAQPQPASQPAGGGDRGAAQPKSGGTLIRLEAAAGDPPSFDIHRESTQDVANVAGPAYNNLVRFDPLDGADSKVVPELAEKWTVSPDGMTYTFNLHKGVKFHNGDPFTSADVKFTLDRVINPPKGMTSPRQTAFSPVKSIETPDDATVVLKTDRPYASLMINLAQGWMAVYSKKWLETNGNDAPLKEVMGTGPFVTDHYTRGVEIVQKRNPNYWDQGRPYLDTMKHLIIPDPNTQLAAFRTGQLDIFAPTATDFDRVKAELGDKAVMGRGGAGLGMSTLYLNTKRKPYDDPRVRQAINLAISRWDSIQVISKGEGVIGGYMRPGGPWSLPEEELLKMPGYGKDKTQDLAKAKQLLADAGFPSGFNSEIRTRQTQSYVDGSIFVIDQVKKIGINLTLKQFETAQAYEVADKGDYDFLYWGHGFALDDPDAVYNEFYQCNSPRNWSRLCVPEVDALFDKQSKELDPAKRKDLVLQLEKLAIPTNIKIIASWGTTRYGYYAYVKGYVPHASGYNNIRFDTTWLDK